MTTLPMMEEYELGRCEITVHEAGFGGLETERGMLPMRAMKVDTQIVGLTARTTLRQTFRNVFDTRLEATYIFPLPARAAVRHFRMVVDGRVVEGEIQERAKARETYEKAIESGKRASIVEQERPDVFTIRVGNLAPGEEAEIEFELVGPLVFADGQATWRFPLVVAPRYVPGTPIGDDVGSGVAPDTDRVPDASRVTPATMLPGYPNPVDLQMRVSVDGAGLPITDLRGSLPAEIAREGDRRIVEIQPGQRLNKDFIVRFKTTADEVESALCFSPDEDGDSGTFELTVMPPQPDIDARKPRDVVFVLDRSGSMGGWKMVAARRAMARMVDTLTPNDTFTVIAFDTTNESPDGHAGKLVAASDRNRWKAAEFLAGVDARGGTDLDAAIDEAIDRVGNGYDDRERQIIVVTDGQVSQEAAVIELVKNRGKGIRFFTVGIDRAVNASLLQRMAEWGGGACELVESEDRLDDVMSLMHRRMEDVVVDELSLDFTGLDVDTGSLAPARHDALFAGMPLIVRGRASRSSAAELGVRITGRSGDSSFESAVTGEERREEALGSMWARHRLINLEDTYDATNDRSLIETITNLSLEFHVLCRFTAFVAVDHEGEVDTSTPLHQVNQLVEQPEGWASPQATAVSAGVPPSARGGMVAQSSMSSDGFGGAPPRARKMAPSAPPSKREVAHDLDEEMPVPDMLSASKEALSEREGAKGATFQKLLGMLRRPARATEEDVLIAVLVYLVSGAWTLDHEGLDPRRAAAVLGESVLRDLVDDLTATLSRLIDASAMIPEGQLAAFSAKFSLGEAASIVANLDIEGPDSIAGAQPEDLVIEMGALKEKKTRSAFWK